MDKTRFRLLICLIFIFAITVTAFFLALCGKENISGTVIKTSSVSTSSACALYLPGVIFIGLIIMAILYLEKN